MQPFQERVVAELKDLDDKISKLQVFIHGGMFNALPSQEQERMTQQLSYMQGYSSVLKQRIEAFTP
jgi:hypothetical protein